MADHTRPAITHVGTVGAKNSEQLAVPARLLFGAFRTSVDSTIHQSPQAERGEPVKGSGRIGASVSDCELEPPSSFPFLMGVRDGYERWAPTYDHLPNPLLAREERYVVPLLPSLRNCCVLDLACGTGRWLTRLSGRVVQGDCLRLPFQSSIFDFSICSFALGHFQDLRSAAAEFSRVMKPDADLFVTELHPEAYARGWRTGFRDEQSAVQLHTLPHSVEDIFSAFNSAGCGCITHVGLCLGEPERLIFADAGRQHLFQAACRVPAVLFCHFKRVSKATVYGRMP